LVSQGPPADPEQRTDWERFCSAHKATEDRRAADANVDAARLALERVRLEGEQGRRAVELGTIAAGAFFAAPRRGSGSPRPTKRERSAHLRNQVLACWATDISQSVAAVARQVGSSRQGLYNTFGSAGLRDLRASVAKISVGSARRGRRVAGGGIGAVYMDTDLDR
jgi:hypothetical protein